MEVINTCNLLTKITKETCYSGNNYSDTNFKATFFILNANGLHSNDEKTKEKQT